ncbi:C40 family peptidase [Brevibacillus humidisoli]|uniref:C40 family peptidase n=1 Tax=Brevibacillus humidisoli TaxID=2895522 RepID=UPI001E2FB3D0|nr:NlpC/P60 family protein [Brevibacillus humidisoli]UFJ42390.1 C40 family peptidase [Brevibacillus humidisoli]
MTQSSTEMIVHVSVAQVWTSAASPRDTDAPLLDNPVKIKEWLQSMSLEQRLGLHDDDLVQTQLLYGERVLVIDEEGEWVKVAIPTQPSIKDERGYPGWLPKRQLSPAPTAGTVVSTGKTAVVTVPTARLYDQDHHEGIEISFRTQLPVLEEKEDWVRVATPHGEQFLKRDQIKLIVDGELPAVGGAQLVETGKMFLDLPYLWSGMSAYGYDCSGFVYSIHRFYGITIPRDASNQAMDGQLVPPDQLQPGDLLFFAYEEGKGRVHHVGMYAGDGKMLHSPKTGKSIEITPLVGYEYEKEHCISRRYWQAR